MILKLNLLQNLIQSCGKFEKVAYTDYKFIFLFYALCILKDTLCSFLYSWMHCGRSNLILWPVYNNQIDMIPFPLNVYRMFNKTLHDIFLIVFCCWQWISFIINVKKIQVRFLLFFFCLLLLLLLLLLFFIYFLHKACPIASCNTTRFVFTAFFQKILISELPPPY